MIEGGSVAVDGRTIRDPGHRVNSGAAIVVAVPEALPATAAEAIPLAVVYEDDDIIVIDKPSGLVVHPAAGNARNAGQCADRALRRHPSGIGGERRPGIVHRLDKDTTA